MKIRQGFVSNSSSSSFVIVGCHLTPLQIEQIKNHITVGAQLGIEWANESDRWGISVDDCLHCGHVTSVRGYTSMDNFNMCEFLEKIGVDMKKVEWGD